MNPLMQILGGSTGNDRTSLFLKALGAFSRGESPEQFLKSLAQNDQRFKGIDFDHLEQTCNDLCQKKGVNKDVLVQQVKNELTTLQ